MLQLDGKELRPSLSRELGAHAGFINKREIRWERVSDAFEQKYGKEVLEWFGLSIWKSGRPASWCRHLFLDYKEHNECSVSNIAGILYLGLFFDSLEEFTSTKAEAMLQGAKSVRLAKQQPSKKVEFGRMLPLLLKRASPQQVAAKLGVTITAVAKEAGKQKLSVPLPDRIQKKLGRNGLKTFKSAIAGGTSIDSLKKQFSLTDDAVYLIFLSDPELQKARQVALEKKDRERIEYHKQQCLEFKAANPSGSKTSLKEERTASYRYLLRLEPEWLAKHFPRMPIELSRRLATNESERDALNREYVQRIAMGASVLRNEPGRPVQVTRARLLRYARARNAYYGDSSLSRRDVLSRALERFSEKFTNYRRRVIAWAVSELTLSGKTITSMNLKKKSGIPVPELRKYTDYLEMVLREAGAKASFTASWGVSSAYHL